jgi:histidine triad (HIT) family protein
MAGNWQSLEDFSTPEVGEISWASGSHRPLTVPGDFATVTGMADKTLFEKICAREIPADIVYEDEQCVAFRDISAQAPQHFLIVPRRAIPRIGAAAAGDAALLGHLLLATSKVAQTEGISGSGYRLVINNGPDGGETVPHLHIHLLGGRALGWPPG